MATSLSKEEYIELAKAFIIDNNLTNDIEEYIRGKTIASGIDSDFVGIPYSFGKLHSVALKLLGDNFSYWYYDCDQDFVKFCFNVEDADGTHPDVDDLGGLWEYEQESK